MTRIRLNAKNRKERIQDVALELFLAKGFQKTTMQEIAEACDLSIGGFYHHYKNSTQILYDLMLRGDEIRKQQLSLFKNDLPTSISTQEISKFIVDKILSRNKFQEMYVAFLQASQHNRELYDLYKKIEHKSITDYQLIFKSCGYEFSDASWKYITDIINTLLVGQQILNTHNTFEQNRLFIEKCIDNILTQDIKGHKHG